MVYAWKRSMNLRANKSFERTVNHRGRTVRAVALCARLQLVRGPVRKSSSGRPLNGIVRQHERDSMEQRQKCDLCAPSSVLSENELAYVRPDSYSLSRGHVIAVPKRHVADFFEMTP